MQDSPTMESLEGFDLLGPPGFEPDDCEADSVMIRLRQRCTDLLYRIVLVVGRCCGFSRVVAVATVDTELSPIPGSIPVSRLIERGRYRFRHFLVRRRSLFGDS